MSPPSDSFIFSGYHPQHNRHIQHTHDIDSLILPGTFTSGAWHFRIFAKKKSKQPNLLGFTFLKLIFFTSFLLIIVATCRSFSGCTVLRPRIPLRPTAWRIRHFFWRTGLPFSSTIQLSNLLQSNTSKVRLPAPCSFVKALGEIILVFRLKNLKCLALCSYGFDRCKKRELLILKL